MKGCGHSIGVATVLLLAHHGLHAQAGMTLAACIEELRRELPAHREVKPLSFDTYTRDVTDLRPTIESATQVQPEFQLPIWDYLARRVDAQRVAQGIALLDREAAALQVVAERHGVDAATTVAVFGVETDYGRVSGAYPVVDATLSRACLNLKSAERKQHFFAALWLLQQGVVQRADFTGSWAGAFGMTQFMPGTFIRYMSDGADLPAADIIHNVADALATTARYLRGLGWTRTEPWGVEVKVPAALGKWHAPENEHACLADAKAASKCRSVAYWKTAGVTRADGRPLDGPATSAGRLTLSTTAALLLPAGSQGPAWLVTPNYQAIWRYNRADAYALAIGLLSDALRGGPAQRVAWPTDDPGLSRAEFVELQTLLRRKGHCEVKVDGAEGPRTRSAIRDAELQLGLPATGRAGTRVLTRLRSEGSAAPAPCEPAQADAAASPATAPASAPDAAEPAAARAAPAASAPASSPEPVAD